MLDFHTLSDNPDFTSSLNDREPMGLETDANGCVLRNRDANTVEVWGRNVSEHYLVTVNLQHQPIVDVVWLT